MYLDKHHRSLISFNIFDLILRRIDRIITKIIFEQLECLIRVKSKARSH